VRVGIVGAGRTRQGLGPFLARWLEAAGAQVIGVSGRERARARAAAASLTSSLRHPVACYADAQELARAVDLLVVACPIEGHLAGLDAALDAGVPCLCEKPLVSWADWERGLERVAAFRERGLLLVENCQWPFVLPALDALYPEARKRPIRSIAMRLSPAWPGPTMLEDSLSHALSLLQALVTVPADAHLGAVTQTDARADATENLVRFRVHGGAEEVQVELHLKCAAEQPRPAWFSVEGARLDRQVGEDYAISFRGADGREANVQDPLASLVYGLLADLKANERDRSDAAADAISLRLRLYGQICERLDGGGEQPPFGSR